MIYRCITCNSPHSESAQMFCSELCQKTWLKINAQKTSTTPMQNLKEIIDLAEEMNDTHEIVPGFIVHVDGDRPRYLHAILERTGIVSEIDMLDVRGVVNLKRITAWPQDVRWTPLARAEQTRRNSARRGQKKLREWAHAS